MFLDPKVKAWNTKIQTLKVREQERGNFDNEKFMQVIQEEHEEKTPPAAAAADTATV